MIWRGRRLDNRRFASMTTQDLFGIPNGIRRKSKIDRVTRAYKKSSMFFIHSFLYNYHYRHRSLHTIDCFLHTSPYNYRYRYHSYYRPLPLSTTSTILPFQLPQPTEFKFIFYSQQTSYYFCNIRNIKHSHSIKTTSPSWF